VPRPIHTSASTLISAPPRAVLERYARWQDWPTLFPATIRGVRLVHEEGNARSLEVDHVEGLVPNVMTVVSDEVIVLEEHKRRYDARFENRFERAGNLTRFVVTADVELRGLLRWLRPIAKPFIRSRIRKFVLEPMRHAAEATAA
jgi:hypothetical protein